MEDLKENIICNEGDLYTILVNKDNQCPDNLNFEIVDVNSLYMNDRYLEKEAFNMWKLFQEQAKKDGFHIEIESGYRSKELQQQIWDEIVLEKGLEHTKKYVAVPGYSEHQTGLALDICLEENGKYYCDTEFTDHKVVKYIADNAYRFGFIVRYPKGKEEITGYNYEPWHIRYVGLELAKELTDNNLTLEEYYDNKYSKKQGR